MGEFSTSKKQISSCSVRRLSIVVLMFFLCFLLFRMEISNFRIGTTLRVLLSQILNFTTSDTRQDGQSPPFTASSSQRVRGMRNCRASIVAETEKPFLIHGASAPISTAVCFVDSRKSTRDC